MELLTTTLKQVTETPLNRWYVLLNYYARFNMFVSLMTRINTELWKVITLDIQTLFVLQKIRLLNNSSQYFFYRKCVSYWERQNSFFSVDYQGNWRFFTARSTWYAYYSQLLQKFCLENSRQKTSGPFSINHVIWKKELFRKNRIKQFCNESMNTNRSIRSADTCISFFIIIQHILKRDKILYILFLISRNSDNSIF